MKLKDVCMFSFPAATQVFIKYQVLFIQGHLNPVKYSKKIFVFSSI